MEQFDFYGLAVTVESTCRDLEQEVGRDFAYFRSAPRESAALPLRIELHRQAPSFDGLPALPAAFFTPRNVCFRDAQRTYIDYFGRALAVHHRAERHCAIYSTDYDLAHEIAYLLILSWVGQHLDATRRHRLHALGVSYEGRGILLALPSGGGKSTMALQLLEEPGFRLLAEDTPLIDRHGIVHPFPLRVGVRPESTPAIPAEFLRTMNRMEFDPKTLIDIEYFRDRLGTAVPPAYLLVGERNLGRVSAIEPLPKRQAFAALLKYMIVGLGVYQGLELLLERGSWEILGKGGTVASRAFNAWQLLRRAPAYRFVLGRDLDRNYRTLLEFVTAPRR